MARDNGERTEKPTPKRRRESRRKGQVARSPDLAGFATLLAASMLLPRLFGTVEQRALALISQSEPAMARPSANGALAVMEAGLVDIAQVLLPVLAAFMVIALLANVAQTGLTLAPAAASPQWSRVNPVAGFRKVFSVTSLWNLAKQILKLGIVLVVAYQVVIGAAHQLLVGQPVDLAPVLDFAAGRITGLVRDAAGIGFVLSIADFAFQRRKLNRSLKMTKQEVRDELRQSEGDPLLRRQRRRVQITMSRQRMMAAVAGADMVITNPTHYAVALRYEPAKGSAPRVVAKGVDELALRIRQEAGTHGVPVVEDPPLARAIYGSCPLDAQIPRELYLAVARLLAFVLALPLVVRRSGTVHRRPTTALVA